MGRRAQENQDGRSFALESRLEKTRRIEQISIKNFSPSPFQSFYLFIFNRQIFK